MHKRVLWALYISSAALVLSGYLALASVREYGVVVLLAPITIAILWPLGEYLDARFPAYRIITKALVIAYLCFIPLTLFVFGLLNAVVALVIFVQTHSLCHRKTARNYYYAYLMAFFLLLAACVMTPEPVIGMVLFLFLLSAIWAFLSLRLHEEARLSHTRGTPWIISLENVPARYAAESGNLFDWGLVGTVSVMSLAAVLMTAAIFVLTPRIEAGFLGRPEADMPSTGLSPEVSLADGGYVQEDTTAVMRVEFPEEPGGRFHSPDRLYWRCTSLPAFFRSQWSRDILTAHYETGINPLRPVSAHFSRLEDTRDISRTRRPQFPLIHQTIYMDNVPPQGIPCLDRVQRISIRGQAKDIFLVWDSALDFTVLMGARGSRHLAYDVWSEFRERDAESLREANDHYAEVLSSRDFRLLTYHDLLPETLETVQRLTQNQPTVYDKAVAIERWLSGSDFEYTLDVPSLPLANAIDVFINEVRRGHCELYASAMALMLRSLGIPARVVSGFRGAEWNDSDQSYTVRASMAHLWTEVYFPGEGWVVFDPAPQGNLNEATRLRRFINSLSAFRLKSQMIWYQEVIGFSRDTQIDRLRSYSLGIIQSIRGDSLDAGIGVGSAGLFGGLINVPLALAACMVLFVALILRRRNRSEESILTEDQNRAVRLYKRVVRRAVQFGADHHGKTAEELQQDLARNNGPAVLIDIIDLYNEVRFGRRPLDPETYKNLRKTLRSLHPG